MSTTKSTMNIDTNSYKNPFSISQLIIGLFLSTYFLTVELVEFNLSLYVLQESKPEFYQEYLIFKSQASIWKWWQLCTTFIIPLSIIDVLRGLFHIFTRTATMRRNLLDVLQAVQLFGILYIIFICIIPLESKLVGKPSNFFTQELYFFHQFAFALNILGWLLPLFRYYDWKNDQYIANEKKAQ